MDTPRWAQILNIAFPTLSREGFQIVAQPSDKYNCIAYAVGDFHNWWDYSAIQALSPLFLTQPLTDVALAPTTRSAADMLAPSMRI